MLEARKVYVRALLRLMATLGAAFKNAVASDTSHVPCRNIPATSYTCKTCAFGALRSIQCMQCMQCIPALRILSCLHWTATRRAYPPGYRGGRGCHPVAAAACPRSRPCQEMMGRSRCACVGNTQTNVHTHLSGEPTGMEPTGACRPSPLCDRMTNTIFLRSVMDILSSASSIPAGMASMAETSQVHNARKSLGVRDSTMASSVDDSDAIGCMHMTHSSSEKASWSSACAAVCTAGCDTASSTLVDSLANAAATIVAPMA